MLKAAIIDDEAKARRILAAFIEEYCPQVALVGNAPDVVQGVKLIQREKPDIVFLDIEMPGYNGFQLLEFFDDIDFEIIFVTANNEFALKAFQVSAVDYLLKPLQITQLVKAVEKAEKIKGNSLIKERLATLKTNMEQQQIKKIVVPVSEGSLFIELKDITHLRAEGSYVNIFLKDGNKILVSKNIKDYEDQLTSAEGFFRTHRSFLVNARYIKSVAANGTEATVPNNQTISIARERKPEFGAFLKSINSSKE
jgi:two-component system, LytTR family, response regulator